MRKIAAADGNGRMHIAGEGDDRTGWFVYQRGNRDGWSGYFAVNQTISFFKNDSARRIDVHWDGSRFSAAHQTL